MPGVADASASASPWAATGPDALTFVVSAGMQKTVPLMFKQTQMRYAKKKGFQMAALCVA